MKKRAILALAFLTVAAGVLAQSENHPTRLSEEGARVETSIDVSADGLSALSADACTANATTLCLNNARFQARVTFSVPSQGITNAPAQAVPLTGDTGYFWFFSANNVEITLKVVDGRAFNGFFWAFYAALSDVAYTITITDMDTGAVKSYSNSQGSLASVADVRAFGATSCTPAVSGAVPASFGSGGGTGSISVTAISGCAWTATSNSGFVTITSGASGTGNGTVSFSVAANSSSSARSGSLTVAGQTISITQAGAAAGGLYDGSWSGTTSQGRTITFTIANNVITAFSIRYIVSGSCGTAEGPFTFTTPGMSGNGFTIATQGSISFVVTVNGTFQSGTAASGTVSAQLSPPTTSCNMTGSGTWTATKN